MARLLLGLLVALVGINRSSALVVPRKGGDDSRRSQLHDAVCAERRGVISVMASSLSILAPASANASSRDPKTGILLPSEGEIASAIPLENYDDDDNPSGKSFARLDSASDGIFYSEPRFVEHVDAQAVQSMTQYISSLLKPGDSVLDLCSSWTSHIDPEISKGLKTVAGLGMNAEELKSNSILTDWTVQDLNSNKNVKLPYEDGSFDVVLIQLSIDYLLYPVEVASELFRVLAKGGKVAILYSNRLFIQKAGRCGCGLRTAKQITNFQMTIPATSSGMVVRQRRFRQNVYCWLVSLLWWVSSCGDQGGRLVDEEKKQGQIDSWRSVVCCYWNKILITALHSPA